MTYLKNLSFFAIIAMTLLISSCAAPIAKFSIKGEENVAPTEVEFTNESDKAETYFWDFGDGKQSNEASPKHEYTSSGNYEVTLKAYKGKKESVVKQRIVIDAPEDCLVELKTDFGTMTIRLYNETPLHRDNFAKLVEQGYYEELLFHRVINGFMIQGGDPNSRRCKPTARLGTGGPGYRIPAEFNQNLVHKKGALCAARTGGPSNPEKESSGSQFYIVQGRPLQESSLERTGASKGIRYSKDQIETYTTIGGTPQLDMEYTVFGEVIDGLDIIDKIANVKTKPGDRPVEDVKMEMKLVK